MTDDKEYIISGFGTKTDKFRNELTPEQKTELGLLLDDLINTISSIGGSNVLDFLNHIDDEEIDSHNGLEPNEIYNYFLTKCLSHVNDKVIFDNLDFLTLFKRDADDIKSRGDPENIFKNILSRLPYDYTTNKDVIEEPRQVIAYYDSGFMNEINPLIRVMKPENFLRAFGLDFSFKIDGKYNSNSEELLFEIEPSENFKYSFFIISNATDTRIIIKKNNNFLDRIILNSENIEIFSITIDSSYEKFIDIEIKDDRNSDIRAFKRISDSDYILLQEIEFSCAELIEKQLPTFNEGIGLLSFEVLSRKKGNY